MVFCSPPDEETKQLLKFLKIKMMVKRPAPRAGANEILVSGGGPIHGLKDVLAQVGAPAGVEHFIPKPDCSEQLWICGSYAVRLVTCSEDLFEELPRGKQKLCVLDEQNLMVRAAAGKIFEEARKAKGTVDRTPYKFRTIYTPLELIPKLVKLSPATKYVITCHMKGCGISAGDRARYLEVPQVLRVMGRADSVANKKILTKLASSLYTQ